jgi:hypothetical protein
MLAEHHVDQRAGAINGAVEITPLPVDFDVGLVNVPAAARLAPPASPQTFNQCQRKLGFPVANRLIAENDAVDRNILGRSRRASL